MIIIRLTVTVRDESIPVRPTVSDLVFALAKADVVSIEKQRRPTMKKNFTSNFATALQSTNQEVVL
jgi:hypothetical protein